MAKSLAIVPSNRFLKDLKRASRRGKDINKLDNIIELLQTGQLLPVKFRDHSLRGIWADFRECQIEPDWLLIYRIDQNNLYLIRIGTHADLF